MKFTVEYAWSFVVDIFSNTNGLVVVFSEFDVAVIAVMPAVFVVKQGRLPESVGGVVEVRVEEPVVGSRRKLGGHEVLSRDSRDFWR